MRFIDEPKLTSRRRQRPPLTLSALFGMVLFLSTVGACDMHPPPSQKTESDLRQACRGLRAEACRTLGSLAWQGVFLQRDRKRAQRLWSFACHLGDVRACTLRQRELLHGQRYAKEESPSPHPHPQ